MIPIDLGQLMQAAAAANAPKTGVKSRVKHAHAFVYMMRTTGTIHVIDGAVPPVERDASQPERRAYNNALELLANFFSGEISTEAGDDDDELPGPDFAVKLPRMDGPPEVCSPAPDIVSPGDLVTTR